MSHEVTVFIDQLVYRKVMHWVDKSPVEVSGLGKVVSENGIFRVVDAVLLPQLNTATTTDIEPEHVGKAMYLLRESPGDLNWWWHSHVNMGVFWSGTDMDTIKKIGDGGWVLSTVFNKKREHRSSLYLKQPYASHPFMPDSLFIDEIETKLWDESAEALKETWDAEYKTMVEDHRAKSPTIIYGSGSGYGEQTGFGYYDRVSGEFVPATGRKRGRKKKGTAKADLVDKLIENSGGKHQGGYRDGYLLDDDEKAYIRAQYGDRALDYYADDGGNALSVYDEEDADEPIDDLSDEEFEALKAKGCQCWSHEETCEICRPYLKRGNLE